MAAQPCANDDCKRMISDPHTTGFCSVCEEEIKKVTTAWDEQITIELSLEAQFFQWCIDHNQPSPHDP